LTAARFAISAIGLTWLAQRAGLFRAKWPSQREWWLLAGMALTGVVGYNSLLYTGLRFTTGINAALITGVAPLAISLTAAALLRERYARHNALGALVSIGGVAVIAANGSLDQLLRLQLNVGDLAVLAAVVCWSLYSTLSRVTTRARTTLWATTFSNYLGLPLLLLAAVWESTSRTPVLTPFVAGAIVYIGVGPALVAYLTWNEGVRRLGPARATAFFNTLPLFGALLSALILTEPFGPAQAMGGALVIGGSLISAWPELFTA
jgi:drug/metabolite transporter (DMT)-like permease